MLNKRSYLNKKTEFEIRIYQDKIKLDKRKTNTNLFGLNMNG